MTTITIPALIERWTSPDAPRLAQCTLYDPNSDCFCAQGDILHLAGLSKDFLNKAQQRWADQEVANILGITIFESIMIRRVNDHIGTTSAAEFLADPIKLCGPHYPFALKLAHLAETYPLLDYDPITAQARFAYLPYATEVEECMWRALRHDNYPIIYALTLREAVTDLPGYGHRVLEAHL
jgi:hypothetical protein